MNNIITNKTEFLYNTYILTRKKAGISFINESILNDLIKFWFEYFIYICENMNRENLTSDNWDLESVKKSIFYCENVYKNEQKKKLVKGESWLISLFIYFIYLIIPSRFQKGILQGGMSDRFRDRISFILLRIKVKHAKVIVDFDFRNRFLDGAKVLLDYKEYNFLLELMPDIFFSEKLKSNYHLPIYLKGAPNSFLDNNYNYIKLLLANQKVFISGIQHGGGYGEWIDSPYENYEMKISNIFYGWGFFEYNIAQNRFYKSKNKQIATSDKIYWIGRDGLKSFVGTKSHSFNSMNDHLREVSHISFFSEKFNNSNIEFRGHPRNGNDIYNSIQLFSKEKRCDKHKGIKTDDLIQNCQLVIFDCLSQTLLYECIYFRIPFVILLDKFPVVGLSENALTFYGFLKNNNILVTREDCMINDSSLDFIRAYLSGSKKVFFNNEVLTYFEQKFMSKMTIRDI